MKLLLVVGHPNPGSFNHAIAAAVRRSAEGIGWEVVARDLYAENFPSHLAVAELRPGGEVPEIVGRYAAELGEADAIAVVHPNWWGQPPAILKGWVDRVFRPGEAYKFAPVPGGGVMPVGMLRATKALVFTTSNTPEAMEQELYSDPLENLWGRCVFGFVGIRDFYRRNFSSVIMSTPEQRAAWLAETETIVRERLG